MKLLSNKGYIYKVYDNGDGRVYKKERPVFVQYLLHCMHGHSKEYVEIHKDLARLLVNVIADKKILGNPEYLDDKTYTQDKVVTLAEYIRAHSLEENKKIFDSYIELIFKTWQCGFSDLIMNFDRNCGVEKDGTVILIDFNEVSFSKKEVALRITEERWLKCYSYTKYLPEGPLKEYYAKAMGGAMTEGNLDRYWKDNAELLGKTQ